MAILAPFMYILKGKTVTRLLPDILKSNDHESLPFYSITLREDLKDFNSSMTIF
jgi:hypothetical protein